MQHGAARRGARCAAPRHATPRRAAPRRAEPRRAAPRRASPRRAAPRRAAPQHTAPRRAAPLRRNTPRRAAPRREAPHIHTHLICICGSIYTCEMLNFEFECLVQTPRLALTHSVMFQKMDQNQSVNSSGAACIFWEVAGEGTAGEGT